MAKESKWLQSAEKGNVPANFMIDFETFGSNPDTCGIMSVAVVEFTELPGMECRGRELMLVASMETNYERGLDMWSSQQWWNDRGRTPAWSWYTAEEKVSLDCLVCRLTEFFEELEGEDYRLWSRGDFDIRILQRLLHESGVSVPYYAVRDVRTFIRGLHVDESLVWMANQVAHSPLCDCRQAIHAVQLINGVLAESGFYEDKRIGATTDECSHKHLQQVRLLEEGGEA